MPAKTTYYGVLLHFENSLHHVEVVKKGAQFTVCQYAGGSRNGVSKESDVKKNQKRGENAPVVTQGNYLAKAYGGKRYQAHVVGIEPGSMLDNAVTDSSNQHYRYHQTHCEPQPVDGNVKMFQPVLLGETEVIRLDKPQEIQEVNHVVKLAHCMQGNPKHLVRLPIVHVPALFAPLLSASF